MPGNSYRLQSICQATVISRVVYAIPAAGVFFVSGIRTGSMDYAVFTDMAICTHMTHLDWYCEMRLKHYSIKPEYWTL